MPSFEEKNISWFRNADRGHRYANELGIKILDKIGLHVPSSRWVGCWQCRSVRAIGIVDVIFARRLYLDVIRTLLSVLGFKVCSNEYEASVLYLRASAAPP
jgi:hypothetical protein